MKVKLIKPCDGVDGPQPVGHEIEHPDAFRLCELELAEPIDDEAKAAFADFEERQKARRQRIADQVLEEVEAKRVARQAAREERRLARQEAFERKLVTGK